MSYVMKHWERSCWRRTAPGSDEGQGAGAELCDKGRQSPMPHPHLGEGRVQRL